MNNDVLLEAVLASGVVLPAPGPGFLRLQAAAANDDAGPKELAHAVSQDPAITGALLRIANSPVFRPRSVPRSALEAISMLGRTRTLAAAASVALRNQGNSKDAAALEAVWAACACAADHSYRAARATRFKSLADTAYLAALMQDAGIAVVLRRAPEHVGVLRNSGTAIEAGARALDAITGMDHAAAGYLVARNWKLPLEVCEAIRAHHDPRLASRLGGDSRRISLLLAAGRRLRDGASPDWTDWEGQVEAELGLSAEDLDQLALAPD